MMITIFEPKQMVFPGVPKYAIVSGHCDESLVMMRMLKRIFREYLRQTPCLENRWCWVDGRPAYTYDGILSEKAAIFMSENCPKCWDKIALSELKERHIKVMKMKFKGLNEIEKLSKLDAFKH